MKPQDHPVRFSRLKHMALSPAHYLAALDDEDSDTAGRRFGRLCHALILGGDLVVYDGERRGNAWKAFAAEHEGREIVTAKEAAKAERVAESVRSHPIAAPLLVGDRELPIMWEQMGGRPCSSRLDVLGAGFVADVKTTGVVTPERFQRQALRMGYHAQMAWYQDAARFIGRPAPRAALIAVETSAPFAVTVFDLTARALDEGRKLCRLWMERLLVCEQADYWPSYTQSVVELDIPDLDDGFELIIDGEGVAA